VAGPTYDDRPGYDPDTGLPTYNPNNGLPTYCPGGCTPANIQELKNETVTITFTLTGCSGDCDDSASAETVVLYADSANWPAAFTCRYVWIDDTGNKAQLSYDCTYNQPDCTTSSWTLIIYPGDGSLTYCWHGCIDAPITNRFYDGEAIPRIAGACTGPASITVNWT
jgi:hypothetical protein